MFNTTRFDPNNPGAFNTASDDVIAQLAMALGQRMQREPERGQMVSGWYVPPSRSSGVANVLSNVLGTYMQAKGMQSQADTKKEQAKAFAHALKMLREPGADEDELEQKLSQARTNPAAFTYAKPETVGPQDEPVAQSFPVEDRGASIQFRDLPKATPLARAQAAAAAPTGPVAPAGPTLAPQQALLQAKRELMNDEAAAGLSVGEFNARVQARASELMGASRPIAAPTVPVAQVTPQPAQPVQAAPAAPLAAAMAAQAPQAPVAAPAPEPTFNYDRGAHEQQVRQAAGGLARAQAARRDQALALMAASGPRGEKFADALLAAQLSPKNNEGFTLKEGETRYDASGRPVASGGAGTPKAIGTPRPGPNGRMVVTMQQGDRVFDMELGADPKAEEAVRERTEGLATAKTKLSTLDSTIDRYSPEFVGRGVVGGYWNALMSKIPGTSEKQARMQIEKELLGAGFDFIQSLGSSQVVNSNVEREYLQSSIAAIDWTNPESIQKGLSDIRERQRGTLKRHEEWLRSKGEGGAAPSGTFNGLPAPGKWDGRTTIRPN